MTQQRFQSILMERYDTVNLFPSGLNSDDGSMYSCHLSATRLTIVKSTISILIGKILILLTLNPHQYQSVKIKFMLILIFKDLLNYATKYFLNKYQLVRL